MALKTWKNLLGFLFLLLGAAYALNADDRQESEPVWKITRDVQAIDHSVSRNLMLGIKSYRISNDGKYPKSFADLDNEITSQLARSLGKPVEEEFMLINKHDRLPNEHLEDWRLVMITKDSLDIGRSDSMTGRHLVYADASGELKHVTETEDWFVKWIGDSIPGITFGQTPDTTIAEESIAEVPANLPAPEAVEVAQEVEQSEPAKEESAEVARVEVVEETPEQSSQWWLWLVGALVVVGGLGLALRRKS